MKITKKGLIYSPDRNNLSWWKSHTMAPTAILLNEKTIRVYVGAWDEEGISRIAYIDLDSSNPSKILEISQNPVLEIGEDGMFDENGVFPAHAYIGNGNISLYYTGFQKGHKIRHYNFGGLATGNSNSNNLTRYSKSPVLDRKEEGLLVRAGQSILIEDGIYRTVYSAGSFWTEAGGKTRPTYDVYYQESEDGVSYKDAGTKILSADHSVEHGLGRPQIIKLKGNYYSFYTRRALSMKYFIGAARSKDLVKWERIDDEIVGLEHSLSGWDSEMIYFPSVLEVGDKIYLFYCGNNFGETGFGFAEIEL
jgi:predicted GH43/DUF377 family glycosyl hydrolase